MLLHFGGFSFEWLFMLVYLASFCSVLVVKYNVLETPVIHYEYPEIPAVYQPVVVVIVVKGTICLIFE